ncbi:hypothetical protein AZ09_10585 [Acetobacter aceti 1023]|nr:hypothetical protein AZ09_10585 [Acetobacter aceti 1023]
MTTQNCPDPKRPGVPMFPDYYGEHILKELVTGKEVPACWDADCPSSPRWDISVLNIQTPETVALYFTYVRCETIKLTPTQINEMLAGKYSLPVIQTALRVWNALDDCDRTDADDMIFLENNGLMTRGIVEDADDFEDLEVGETVWNFNAAGHALVAAIRSNLGDAP